jgi:subtilisin family serine protease
MTPEEKYKITSNEYFDFLIKYNGNPTSLERFREYSPHIMNDSFAVIYIPAAKVGAEIVTEFGYSGIPYCYALTSEQSLDASGVNKLRSIPSVNLRGAGTIVGIIDTGIDYTNPIFQRADGTSRIFTIWDQSIDSEDQYPKTVYPVYYGTEYSMKQINEALKNENPMQIVPSTDTNGHGTKLAGIAAGSVDEKNDFSGVASEADLIVVKLKEAKPIVKNYYAIPENATCYQENDIIWGLQYIVDTARQLRRPLAICIGLGTSKGAHDDTGFLNMIASITADFPEVCICISAGNEGNARRHFYSTLQPGSAPIPVELNVGDNESGFSMELWGEPPTIYSIDIISPSGEYIPRIQESLIYNKKINFLFESTVIDIDYIMVEPDTGKQLIVFLFRNPAPGIWKFQVYGRGDVKGEFHIWLPASNFISNNTYFISANEYTTITSPGNSIVPITVTAYNPNNDALYQNAGKGFSTSSIINPDLAAPGVDIKCPTLEHGFTTMTSTSAAAAHMTGIAAMILEWGVVKNNFPNIDTVGIKKFLIRGAKRNSQLIYPNREWGYGIVDVYNSFNLLRSDRQS